MVISITSSRPDPEQRARIEAFLADFLPRLARDQPGLVAAYHYHDDEANESTTLMIWRDDAARLAYREGGLVREAMAMEQTLGLASVRRTFQATYP